MNTPYHNIYRLTALYEPTTPTQVTTDRQKLYPVAVRVLIKAVLLYTYIYIHTGIISLCNVPRRLHVIP